MIVSHAGLQIADATSTLDAVVDRLVTVDLDNVPPDVLTTLVRSIARIESRLAGITAHAVAAAERSGTITRAGASSTTTWLADTTGTTPRTAARTVSLSRAIETSPTVAAAVADGSLGADKATTLAAALDRGVLDPGTIDTLVHDAHDLPAGLFARHVRTREAATDHARLRRDEQHARRRRTLTHRRLPDGTLEGRFRLDPLAGDTFLTSIRATTRPDPADTPPEQRRTRGQRHADALVEIARHALDDGTNGHQLTVRPHITVTVPVQALAPRSDDAIAVGAIGTTDHGTTLTLDTVKTLLCDAAVRRLVTDPDGRPLDVGRTTRTWSGAQRAASAALDGGCRGPSCDRPFAWTQLHHIDWWSHGGHTDLDRGIPVCTHCHHLIHDDAWRVDLDPATRTATWTSPTGNTTTNRPRGPAAPLTARTTAARAASTAGDSIVAEPSTAYTTAPPDPRRTRTTGPQPARPDDTTEQTHPGRPPARGDPSARSWRPPRRHGPGPDDPLEPTSRGRPVVSSCPGGRRWPRPLVGDLASCW